MDGRTDGVRPGRGGREEGKSEEEDAPLKMRRLLRQEQQQLLRDSYEDRHLHYHPLHQQPHQFHRQAHRPTPSTDGRSGGGSVR